MATFWTYDYICSLHEEWTFLLGTRWNKVKGLYILTRFMPFLVLITNLYLNFTPTENPNKCQTLIDIDLSFGIVSAACSEAFFVLRTYVLWNNNRFVLAITLTVFFGVLAACIGTSFIADSTTPYVTPGLTGCTSNANLFIPFLLLFAGELVLSSLTLIRAIQNWRMTKGSMYVILVKHNIFYYGCGLFFSAVNVLTSLLLQYQYRAMFQDLQVIILAILALHMHLRLWQISERTHGHDSLVSSIPLTDMSSVTHMA
ncbi:uncharacterized protein EDB91DRAFT_1135549 [Suillus paluster]|uniref:uncharacterized protein n=1 Tax=Suillus paluster TaxID=48578 RepID=UPI001B8700BA|nr:uncharacterized protein EDB91DRAFT_1135549 [Suillus paluster]KAG1739478.1 hypothetical protein EDB91DRAFT_1135549 [Suillus paluster]